MAIPKNINKEHLLKAIEKIDIEGIPNDGNSLYYDVIFNDKKYPPKLIVSYANIYANGKELDRKLFSGGLGTPCFELLEEYKFIIQKKTVSYYLLGASWYGNEDDPDQSSRFIENGIWENGYGDQFLDIVKGVNIGDRVAIKSSFATRDKKSILRIKSIGTVYKNKGDGRTLQIYWDKSFTPFDLEGYGSYRSTIQKASEEDIDVIFNKVNKMTYYYELTKFLAQANTDDLKTSDYLNNYKELSVKIGFGKGNKARIPWIAFLNGINKVQTGIYPVYLFYKERNLLILAYGVSETNPPNRNWDLVDGKTIEQYFAENNFDKPERYGKSFVYKIYDINNDIKEETINSDLDNIIQIYKSIYPNPILSDNFQYISFSNSVAGAGLYFDAKTSLRLCGSLLTKPFVILTGLSGSGKTKLAQAFAMWICEDETQYCIVPVGADWTNREPLLGFPNALEKEQYVKPDNRVLDIIISANKNTDRPYFLILDEMNLSHVERYFADFLSVMESRNKIALHSGDSDWNNVPPEIGFPENLFIIGTVNIDETTYMFSPKVLDRASVIEFRVTVEEMEEYLESNLKVNLTTLKAEGKAIAQHFVAIAKDNSLKTSYANELNQTLISFFSELKKTGAEFGYRSASEILRFAAVVNLIEPACPISDIIDAAIMQKLLPKIHGSRRKLVSVLENLGSLCLKEKLPETEKIGNYLNHPSDKDFSILIKYPISFEKISRMYKNVLDNGFTSYAEA